MAGETERSRAVAKETKKDLEVGDKDAAEVKGGHTDPRLKAVGATKSPAMTKHVKRESR
jgi:hypothetical protein